MLIQNDRQPQMRPPKNKTVGPVSTEGRLYAAVAIVLSLYLVLAVYTVVRFQVWDQAELDARDKQDSITTFKLMAYRGSIFDRRNVSLASDKPVEALSADLGWMREQKMPTQEQLEALSKLIGEPVGNIADKLASDKQSVYIKRGLALETVNEIRALNIGGLFFSREYTRSYSNPEMFSQILGFTDVDNKGLEGLELVRDDELTGQMGKRFLRRGNQGDYLDSLGNIEAIPGKDLVLSLDTRIQMVAFNALKAAVEHHQAASASAVVLDARTGEILAMANYPSFDNHNQGGTSDPETRRNRAISDMVEPGSVVKPFAVAQALDAGKVRTGTVLDTDPYVVQGKLISDTHHYPSLDMRGIIQKSSNVGSSKLSALFSPAEVHDFYHRLGFDVSTHLGLPGESSGKLHPWEKWRALDQAVMSYGYGLQLSLLQLARSYTVFTNNGKILPVSLIKQEFAPSGTEVINAQTARDVAAMMVSVTEEGGTGRAGAVPGYQVAAKTGTARKAVAGGYAQDKHIALFAGFAPAHAPRAIVAVMVDESKRHGYYGGAVAGPVFKEIMGGTLSGLGVPPSEETKAP